MKINANINIIAIIIAVVIVFPILSVFLSWLFFDIDIWNHFVKYLLFEITLSTFILLIGVGLGVSFLGTTLAYLVVMVDFPARRWLEWGLFIPFAIPAYVIAFIYLGVFDYSGYLQVWIRDVLNLPGFDIRANSLAVIITFVMAFYPYVYMMARASFKLQKIQIIQNSRILGANPFRVFYKVSAPLIRPAIVAGTLVALMETLADFGTVSLFNYSTFTTAIYSAWVDFRSLETAVQISSILVLLAFFLIYFEKKARGKAKYQIFDSEHKQLYRPKGVASFFIFLFVFVIFLISSVIPIAHLIIWSIENIAKELTYHYLELIANTFFLILSATLIVVVIGVLFSLPYNLKRNNKIFNFLINTSTLGYALPGSVMAVSLMYSVQNISFFIEYFGGSSINYLLFGSIFLLLFCYICKFIAISYNSSKASIEQIRPIFIEGASILGASKFILISKIYLPMMRSGIFAGAILVAIDIMKELPATYILRPFGWDTLAIKTYELSADGLFERASVPALIMIIFGLLLIFLFKKINDSKFIKIV